MGIFSYSHPYRIRKINYDNRIIIYTDHQGNYNQSSWYDLIYHPDFHSFSPKQQLKLLQLAQNNPPSYDHDAMTRQYSITFMLPLQILTLVNFCGIFFFAILSLGSIHFLDLPMTGGSFISTFSLLSLPLCVRLYGMRHALSMLLLILCALVLTGLCLQHFTHEMSANYSSFYQVVNIMPEHIAIFTCAYAPTSFICLVTYHHLSRHLGPKFFWLHCYLACSIALLFGYITWISANWFIQVLPNDLFFSMLSFLYLVKMILIQFAFLLLISIVSHLALRWCTQRGWITAMPA